LIFDSIIRGEWAERITDPGRRRKKRLRTGILAAVIFGLFGVWVFVRMQNSSETHQTFISTPPLSQQQPTLPTTPAPTAAEPPKSSKPQKKASTGGSPPLSAPPQQPQITCAPGASCGISSGQQGGTTAGTINNYNTGPDQPSPGITPTIDFCLSDALAVGVNKYVTTITLRTDTPISKPSYGFLFDGPVGGGDLAISGIPKSMTPYVNNLKLQSLEDKSYAFRFLSQDFPNGSDVWNPGVVFTVTVPSSIKVKLVGIFGFFGKDQKPLIANMKNSCD